MVSCEGLGKGGVQSVMMNFIRNMNDSYIFDMLLFTNEIRYYDNEFLRYGGKIFRIPFYSGKNRFRKKIDYYIRGISLYYKIKKVISANGPYQAIHCHNGFESALCLIAAKKSNIPIRICHSHTNPNKSNLASQILNSIYRFFINKTSTHKIGCSLQACDFLFGKKKAIVLNNAYDDSAYSQNKYISQKDSSIRLIQVGHFDNNKNQSFSIDVLNHILQFDNNASLKLIGFGNENFINSLREKVKKYNIENNVSFYDGTTADIPQLMSESDFFIFPSKREGFGITLVEAQAMGLKCFASDSVPKTTNVGGCIYLSLNDGPCKWAQRILSTPTEKNIYDCSKFKISEIIIIMDSIYKGVG